MNHSPSLARKILAEIPYFFAWVAGLVVLGAILGAIFFPLGGWLLDAERTSYALFLRGLRFGSFYFLIWAPAIAITVCVMRGYRRARSHTEHAAAPRPSSPAGDDER